MNNKIIKFQKAGKLPTAATYSLWLKGTFSYLTGIRDRDLVESRYIPSKATDKNTKYYTRKGLDYDVMRNLLGGKESKAKEFDGTPLYYKNFNDLYTRLSTNLNGKQLRTTDNSHLGEYTIGIGQDKNGRYVSYYDKFDWAPNESLEIFSPYEIYNRIYEKDFNRMLKELNDEEYSGSNPSGKWFFKSGINNKGYLKKGGLIGSTNARKWKHEDGGRVKKHLAFVNGVSILDSNPDAYKYVKRKLYKAIDGGNTGNWFSRIGNWLNKNSGTISNIGNTAIGTIANSVSAVGNFNNVKELGKVNLEDAKALNKKKKAQYKPYAYLLALLWALLQTSGTEENISPIVINLLADKIADMLANSESSINQVLALNALMESAASNNMLETITGGIKNGVSAGIEMLGMLGNKSSNNTSSTNTTSTTTSSTTPTYLPSYKYDMMAPYKKNFTFKI